MGCLLALVFTVWREMSAAGLQCEKEIDHISEAHANTALACWFVPTEGLHN